MKSHRMIFFGFGATIVMLVGLIAVWLDGVAENNATFVQVEQQSETAQVLEDARRSLAALSFDSVTVDETVASTETISQLLSNLENSLRQLNSVSGAAPIADESRLASLIEHLRAAVFALTQAGDAANLAETRADKVQDLVNAHRQLSETLDSWSRDLQRHLSMTIAKTRHANDYAYWFTGFLATAVAALIFLAIVLFRRMAQSERELVEHGRRLARLYEVTSMSDLSLDDQIAATLRLGRELLGMQVGKVGHQDPPTNTSTFLHFVGPDGKSSAKGKKIPLDKTFCNITFAADGPLAIHDITNSEYRKHPAYEFLGIDAYIGTTIWVRGKKFGTLNYANKAPLKKPFTQSDIDLVRLMGNWIGVAEERFLFQQELQASKEVAEAANLAKSAFLANMSHEIRTPLTAILGYSDMLREEDQSPDERDHALNSILRAGHHLQQIINDILDLSKIEAGQLVIEHLSMSPFALLSDIDAIFASRAREKGLSFEIDYNFPLPKIIVSDPTRLKQILINLCGNALKFTRAGGIKVTVSFDQMTKMMQFCVIDTGIGMTPEEQGKLFKPFSQADSSTTRKFGGTGLGLCISKQLAQKLGGDIRCESGKGEGSRFYVTVAVEGSEPLELTNVPEKVGASERAAAESKLQLKKLGGRVLIVEDHPDNQDLIALYIQKTGATVTIARNGKEGIELAQSSPYDLILMDMAMPIMDGIEATKTLREGGYDKPIVMLTANAMKEDKDRSLAAGADNYLTKPIDVARLYAVLQEYLPAGSGAARDSTLELLVEITNDPEYKRLARRFAEELPRFLREIEAARQQKNWEQLKLITHRLKGLSGAFGLVEVSAASELVFSDLRNNRMERMDAHVNNLADALSAALGEAEQISPSV